MKIQTNLFGEITLLTGCTLVGSSESLEFNTYVFKSHNGSEQRKPLRETASQVLSINYVSLKNLMAANFNILYGGLRNKWGIPIDVELQTVASATSDFIPCETSIFDYRNDSLALIKKNGERLVVEIKEVLPDGLKLYQPINITNFQICPLRVGFILGDVSSDINVAVGKTAIKFQVLDAPQTKALIPERFLYQDIYFKRILMEGDFLNVSFVQHQTVVDFNLGPIDQHTNWAHAKYGKPLRSLMKNQQELYEYRQFLFRRLGMFRPFWMPTFENNFIVKNTGTVSTTIDAELNQHLEFAKRRVHIAIKANGVWTAHTITNAVLNNNRTRLTITPALNKPASSIQMVSYLGLYRLNNDLTDITYKGAGITESAVSILEIEP